MYFSGLMVFLGLLGAFMGLMKTVHSVSDLIGGMDLSGGSGTDGMAKMIEGMKAPLNGMSVGFSSSLFGLMTSMVLGALERCMTSAMKALRNEFEHWLSNLADLEGGATAAATGQQEMKVTVDADFSDVRSAMEASSNQLRAMGDTLSETAANATQTRAAMGEMAEAVSSLSRSVATLHDPAPLLKPITDTVSELARNQIAMLSHFRGLYDQAEADRAQINAILDAMGTTLERVHTLNGTHLHRQIDNLAVLLADSGPAQPVSPPKTGLLSRLLGGNNAGGLRSEVRRMFLSQRQLVRRQGDALDTRLTQMESGHAVDRRALSTLVAQGADQQARLAELMARLDGGDMAADGTGLTGARMEMDVLRRRLHADVSTDDAPSGSTDTQTARHSGGKG
jgi:hypothetical protein